MNCTETWHEFFICSQPIRFPPSLFFPLRTGRGQRRGRGTLKDTIPMYLEVGRHSRWAGVCGTLIISHNNPPQYKRHNFRFWITKKMHNPSLSLRHQCFEFFAISRRASGLRWPQGLQLLVDPQESSSSSYFTNGKQIRVHSKFTREYAKHALFLFGWCWCCCCTFFFFPFLPFWPPGPAIRSGQGCCYFAYAERSQTLKERGKKFYQRKNGGCGIHGGLVTPPPLRNDLGHFSPHFFGHLDFWPFLATLETRWIAGKGLPHRD